MSGQFCAVERDTNRYLDERAAAEHFDDACEDRQGEMTADFLIGKNDHPETDEIFSDMTSSAQFALALQKVFAAAKGPVFRDTNALTALQLSLDTLRKTCYEAAFPHFEALATQSIEADYRAAGEP